MYILGILHLVCYKTEGGLSCVLLILYTFFFLKKKNAQSKYNPFFTCGSILLSLPKSPDLSGEKYFELLITLLLSY